MTVAEVKVIVEGKKMHRQERNRNRNRRASWCASDSMRRCWCLPANWREKTGKRKERQRNWRLWRCRQLMFFLQKRKFVLFYFCCCTESETSKNPDLLVIIERHTHTFSLQLKEQNGNIWFVGQSLECVCKLVGEDFTLLFDDRDAKIAVENDEEIVGEWLGGEAILFN